MNMIKTKVVVTDMEDLSALNSAIDGAIATGYDLISHTTVIRKGYQGYLLVHTLVFKG